jgi:hypothetical protein
MAKKGSHMEDIEKLARDYKTALENGSETTLDRIVVQEEYQLEWAQRAYGTRFGTYRTHGELSEKYYLPFAENSQ